MTEEKRKPTPEEKAAAAAAAKAKAEEMRRQREAEQAKLAAEEQSGAQESEAQTTEAQAGETSVEAKETSGESPADDLALAKAKAAAAAKAKAAAAAAAAAKAKAAREAAESGAASSDATGDDAEAKAKALAAAKAKAAAAAAAAAKAKAAGGAAGAPTGEETPKPPSKNQPLLEKYVKLITDRFGSGAVEDSYINDLAKEVPTLVIANGQWKEVARFLKEHEELQFNYLSDLHGVDYEDRMEVFYFLYSYPHRQSVAVKVKTDREQPSVPSVTEIWSGANWNEREAYDLLGIDFPGHPDLKRILLPDEWVGHPLRKDYQQYDEEV